MNNEEILYGLLVCVIVGTIFALGEIFIMLVLWKVQRNKRQRSTTLPPPSFDERNWQHRFEKEHRA